MIPALQPPRRHSGRVLATTVLALVLAGCAGGGGTPSADPTTRSHSPASTGSAPGAPVEEARTPGRTVAAPTAEPEPPPLAGVTVVLDPGHQLGNASFPAQVQAPVDAGGLVKPCNSTGTATDGGYPEATLNWEVARAAQRLLSRRGARVLLTRGANSAQQWGPCIDERGRAGNPGEPGPTADLKISIHADGSLDADAHGFHVIAPAAVAPWTTDIVGPSLRLAETVRDVLVRSGFEPSTYAGSGGIDVRGDLGTLNLSDVPTVMVELGNMRHDGDAALMTSAPGRRHYASALAAAVERFVAR